MVKVLDQAKKYPLQMRDVYCRALIDAAEADERVFVLDCDLVSSIGDASFVKRFPDRTINCGIQEANACAFAAGMSSRGFIPFFHSFGVFASRRITDQLYISCAYAGLNVKIVGADPGVTAAVNGGTHMALEDAGIVRVIPGMTIVEPSDPIMMYSLTRKIAAHYGVDYLRMQRKNALQIYGEGSEFELGKGVLLRDGDDVAILASGLMVPEALEAARALYEMGVSARVADMYSIKPIDRDLILDSARKTGAVVTAENHNIIGALGSAVAEVLGEGCPVPLERVGAQDHFGEVRSVEHLKERFGLTAKVIQEKVLRAISRKNK